MDKIRVLEVLQLPSTTTLTLTHLDMVMWGQRLTFHVTATPAESDSLAFQLCFLDCREMRWQVYTHMQHSSSPAFPPSELVNLALGRSQQRSPAQLLTEHFGLSLFYGMLQVIRDEQIITLD